MDRLADVTAAILAGGLGTRLRPVVADRPKPLAEVGGRPFLAYVLDRLAGAGVRRAVLCTGYRGGQIEAAFGKAYRGVDLVYSREPSPLGTGGALRLALPLLRSDAVLVVNGDSYCDADLAGFWHWCRDHDATAALVVTHVADPSRYGRVVVRGERVVRFEEKANAGGPGWVNAGVYLFSCPVIAAIPAGEAISLEKEVLPGLVTRGRLFGYRTGGRFIDIGTPETYAVAAAYLVQGLEGGEPR